VSPTNQKPTPPIHPICRGRSGIFSSFKFLALYGQIPVIGKIEWLATVVIPSIGIGLLLLLPLLDKSPYRHYSRRIFSLAIMGSSFWTSSC